MTTVDKSRSANEIVNDYIRNTINKALEDNEYVWSDAGVKEPVVFMFTRNREDTSDTDSPVVTITRTSVTADTTDIAAVPLYRTDMEVTINIDYGNDPDDANLTGQDILDRYAGRLLRSLRRVVWPGNDSLTISLFRSYISASQFNESNRVRYNTTIILNIRYFSSEG